ncbi:hypothetical protein IFT80_21430 [Pseudomonas sp. CFBP 8771]|uniref:hypothetical protein n=1 Tax=Pseudomonas sp. CFBP 8771 TaxID=2775285 RepID=UPI0017873CD4|nr:hypothetical protein [Pseudomonas sp. CFBP 8771]MBD8605200.1 hypothetical protein [Pseudomonas sp. CFBP 8771]
MGTSNAIFQAPSARPADAAVTVYKVHKKGRADPASPSKRSASLRAGVGILVDDGPSASVPEAIPGHPQNLIPASKNNSPFKISIPNHTSIVDGDLVRLILDNVPINVPAVDAAEVGNGYIREFDATLAHGVHQVTYELEDGGGNVIRGNPPIPLRIDREAPGGTLMPSLIFAQDVVDGGVTLDKLVAGTSGGLVLKTLLPDYYGMEDGDIVKPFYRAVSGGSELLIVSAQKEVPVGGAGEDLELEIPLAALQAMNDGKRYFGYTLTDVAGNVSRGRAEDSAVIVLVSSAPVDGDLDLPDIALFSDDDLISEADARTPVHVKIPEIPKSADGDEVIFYLGTSSTSRLRISTADLGKPFVLEFDLPFDFVANGGGTGSPQRYTAEGYYEIYRGAVKMATSGANPVLVDITIPAGPDPDPNTPENDLLRVVTVEADSGAVDFIDDADLQKDAKVIVPFYADNTATPPVDSEYLLANDVITVYWGGTALANRKTVLAGDIASKIPLVITATSAEMKAKGPGIKAVHYTVARATSGTPSATNVALSFAKDVQVISQDLLPGGPGGLPAGEFTERRQAQNSLNKAQLQDGTPFRVLLDYDNVAEGDEISLTLQGYYGLTGAGTETPNMKLDLSYVLTRDDIQLPGGPVKHHDFLIPATYFSKKWVNEPVGQGSVTAVYSIENTYGTGGPSVPVFVRCYALDL